MSNISFKLIDINLPFLKYFGNRKPLYSDEYIYEASQIVIGDIVSINLVNERCIAEIEVTELIKGKNLKTIRFSAGNPLSSYKPDVNVLETGLLFFTESLIPNEFEMLFFHRFQGNETTDQYVEFVKSKV